MSIPRSIQENEINKFVESTSVAGVPAIAVANPDGSNISTGGGGDGAINDGVSSSIKATVLDYTSSNPLAVRLTDTSGDYVAAGAGTQYTEDAAAAANPVGGALMLVREDARAGSLTTTDGDNVAARGNNKGELYVKSTDSDALLTTIDADTSNISTKIDTVAGAVSGTEMQVDIVSAPTLTVNSHAVTNAGTFAVQVDGAALTSLQLIDDTVYTDGSGTVTKGVAILGQDGTNPQAIKTDASGELQVDVLTMPTVTVTATNLDVQSGGADLATTTQAGAIQTAVELIDDAIFVDDTATHSTGTTKGVGIMGVAVPTDTSISANDIGMFAMSTDRRMFADATLQLADTDISSTNALPTKGVPSDIDINGSNANHAQKYYTNSGAVTDGIIWSPAAGKRWHILTLYINVSAAATVTLEDDLAGGDSAVWKGDLAANSGVVLTYDKEHPFSSTEDAADLIITTSAGNVYVQAVGYEV